MAGYTSDSCSLISIVKGLQVLVVFQGMKMLAMDSKSRPCYITHTQKRIHVSISLTFIYLFLNFFYCLTFFKLIVLQELCIDRHEGSQTEMFFMIVTKSPPIAR
jgi:hypothetical protein